MTFPILPSNGPSGYNLTRSLRFRSSASAYLNRTFTTPTNNKIWTWSGWLKRGVLGSSYAPVFGGGSSGANYSLLWFTSSDTLTIFAYNSATQYQLTTTQVFRDPSAWYHIVIAVDTTQATASNRVKLYVNGSQVTAFSTATYPSLNYNDNINSAVAHYFAQFTPALGSNYYDGYLTEVNFIDGQALTPSSFGSTNTLTGVWQPARYTGTYGTNGFYLPFTDNSALTTSSNVGLGKDFSGNGNYWTTNNISITSGTTYDSMTDVPTLTSATAANFAVLNPLLPSGAAPSSGNINFSLTGATNNARGTMAFPQTGKWYCEVTVTALGGGDCFIGIMRNSDAYSSNDSIGSTSGSYVYRSSNGAKLNNGTSTSYGSSYTANDVIGVAFDASAGTLTFYKNNTSQGTAFTGLTDVYTALLGITTSSTNSFAINFGQRPFAYTPPTGYVALNTYNLPTSTIVKGNTVMDAVLYTGNGGTNTITNAAGFKPDFAWQKARGQAYAHGLYDSVRGVTKKLSSNSTDAEGTSSGLTAFNSNGITLGSDAGENLNASSFVSWQWQAGQGSTSSNTSGSITSTVSVNASAGFSIVVYTGNGTNGATVGHGLGVKPSLIIEKGRSTTYSWSVQGCGVLWPTATQTLFLNGTNALNPGSGVAAPTSSVFTPSATLYANESGVSNIAYCWTPIAGYSAFGSYTGNGSTDGPFIYLGFRPKFVLIKMTSSTGDWYLYDSSRDPYNATQQGLSPNSSASETTYTGWGDLLSNGFKIRRTDAAWNSSGGSYIYIAFAENPFKNALAR